MFAENIYNPTRFVLDSAAADRPQNYIFWPMGSGRERLQFLSFLTAFADQTGQELTVAVLAGSSQPLLKFFPSLTHRIVQVEVPGSSITQAFSDDLLPLTCYLLNSDRPLQGKVFFTNVGTYLDGRLADQWRRSGRRDLSHVSLVRHILGLPPSVAPQSIDLGPLPKVADLVFFAPVANFFQVDYHAFLPMAEKCRASGLRVAWNFSQAEFARLDPSFASQIAGDTLFKGSLAEALRFAKMSKLVVAARSSFCELLSLSGSTYGVVFDVHHSLTDRSFWSLDYFGTRPIFEVDTSQTEQLFQKIN
jgi:hypothetical protein